MPGVMHHPNSFEERTANSNDGRQANHCTSTRAKTAQSQVQAESSTSLLLWALVTRFNTDKLTSENLDPMNPVDLEVVNVLFFQQMLEAVEAEQWDAAAMALYKLYAIEEGERFSDLTDEPDQLNRTLDAAAA